MSAQPSWDPVEVLAQSAAELGATVGELRRDLAVRREVVARAGFSPAPGGWPAVGARLEAITVRAAGDRTRCRRCQAPVRWVVTASSGSRMPIDPLPHRMGNVVLEPVSGRGVEAVVHGNDELPLAVEAFRSHFATCPRVRRAEKPSPTLVVVASCRVGLCSWQVSSSDRAERDRAFEEHYRVTHLDRCDRCGQGPLLWARRWDGLSVCIAIDPVSPKGGRWSIERHVTGPQLVVVPAPSLIEGFAEHECPGVSEEKP